MGTTALTPAQHIAAARAGVLAITDPAERTRALTDLAEELAGAQAAVRQDRTDALRARVDAGERPSDLARELGITATRIKQLLAPRTPAERDARAKPTPSPTPAPVVQRTPPRPQRLEARRRARAELAARRRALVAAARVEHPNATNSELAQILTAQLGEPVTRQHVTAWDTPAPSARDAHERSAG